MEIIQKKEISIESNSISKTGNRSESKQFSSYHSNFNFISHTNRNGMKITSDKKKQAQKYHNRNDSSIQKKHTPVSHFNQLNFQRNFECNTIYGKI